MFSRRDFLGVSAAGKSAAALQPVSPAASRRVPLGVQLYTVRKQAEVDLPRVLVQIRKVGYEEVELYWNVYTHPAAELRQMIADAGLRAPSGHFDYNGMASKLDYASELGVKYVICPMLPNNMRSTADDFKRAASQFNQWGEEVESRGMHFGFHNHNYEFHPIAATAGFNILMNDTDPKLVRLEMDCYWITQAGRDPIQMLKQYRDRVRMLHLKDRKPGFPASQELNSSAEHFTEVGNGTINWKAILAVAEAQSIEHYFVEQDSSDKSPIESIRASYNYLQKLMA
jgi:sugar phosphate isomerase/epimerase